MILDQVPQRQLLRLAVTAKTKHFLRKRSPLPAMAPQSHHLLTDYRLSREEREAAYIRARERIFGKEEKSGEDTPGMLRIYL